MKRKRPETLKLSVTEARKNFSSLLNRVYSGAERVVIEKNGIPVAALISGRDFRRLEALERQRERDFEVFKKFGAAFADVPLDELEREVERAVREAREELRREREEAASPR